MVRQLLVFDLEYLFVLFLSSSYVKGIMSFRFIYIQIISLCSLSFVLPSFIYLSLFFLFHLFFEKQIDLHSSVWEVPYK